MNKSQIDDVVKKAMSWLKSQRSTNGEYGKWGIGSTSLAVMGLASLKLPDLEPLVTAGMNIVTQSEPDDSVYFRSLRIMAVTAVLKKGNDAYLTVCSDAQWLIEAQGSDALNTLIYGGWGHNMGSQAADASNTHFAILALYDAMSWGFDVPTAVWSKALTWYHNNHDYSKGQSYVYSMKTPFKKDDASTFAITASTLCSLKIIALASSRLDIKLTARTLGDDALRWLSEHNDLKPEQGMLSSWDYHGFFSLYRGFGVDPQISLACNFEPYLKRLIESQDSDGKWSIKGEDESTSVIYTSMSLLFISGYPKAFQSERESELLTPCLDSYLVFLVVIILLLLGILFKLRDE